MQKLDLSKSSLREINETLQAQSKGSNQTEWEIKNPKGAHAIACGLGT